MKANKGMKSARMPQQHFEKNMGDLPVCKEKYASEFGNPDDLMKSAQGLVNFAKAKKMKY